MNWLSLNSGTAMRCKGSMVLIVRPDGTGFYGQVIAVERAYVELQNGNFKNLVRFDRPAVIAQVNVPDFSLPMVGSPRLFP